MEDLITRRLSTSRTERREVIKDAKKADRGLKSELRTDLVKMRDHCENGG